MATNPTGKGKNNLNAQRRQAIERNTKDRPPVAKRGTILQDKRKDRKW